MRLVNILSLLILYSCNLGFMTPNSSSELSFSDNSSSSSTTPSQESLAPEIIDAKPSGLVDSSNKKIVVRAITSSKSFCKIDDQDLTFSTMERFLSPDSLGINHELSVDVEPNREYIYFIRCRDWKQSSTSKVKKITFSTQSSVTLNPPVIYDVKPQGSVSNSQVEISLRTTINSTCKFDEVFKPYASMSSQFETSDKLIHRYTKKVISKKAYTFFIRCLGQNGVPSKDPGLSSFTVGDLGLINNKAPEISDKYPNMTLSSSTVAEVISLRTNEPATCYYSDTSSDFTKMNKMRLTGTMAHAQSVNNLVAGKKYNYNVICEDLHKKKSILSIISFSIEAKMPSPTNKPQVVELYLANAETNTIISPIPMIGSEFTIDTSIFGKSLTIEARAINEGSITFESGIHFKIESTKPYLFNGDPDGVDFTPWTLGSGKHQVKIIAYSDKAAQGAQGDPVIINLNIVDKDTEQPFVVNSMTANMLTGSSVVIDTSLSENGSMEVEYWETLKGKGSSIRNTAPDDPVITTMNQKKYSIALRGLKPLTDYQVIIHSVNQKGVNIQQHFALNFRTLTILPPSADLASSVRQILDTSCISCHSPGKQAEFRNLALDIRVLAKDRTLVTAQDPLGSKLYQKVMEKASMRQFLPSPAIESKIIMDWIASIDPNDKLDIKCELDEEVLDNICVKRNVAIRSLGYRKLTMTEIYNVINSGLYLQIDNTDSEGQIILPKEKNKEGFSNAPGLMSLSASYIQAMEILANKVGTELNKKATFNDFIPCYSKNVNECAPEAIDNLTLKLMRVKLSDAEKTSYIKFLQSNSNKKQSYINLIKAIILSPSFLFREEHGVNPDPMYKMSAMEVGSRMAFFLTGSTPDSVLLESIKSNKLFDKNERVLQAKRILATEKSKDHLAGVFLESIGVKDLAHSKELKNDMYKESTMLVKDVFFTPNKKWTDILTSKYTFVNKRLADIYKIPSVLSNSSFVKVNYPNNQRSGILSHASYLGAFYSGGSPENTKDIKRGLSFMKNILCQTPRPLPPGIDPDVDPATGVEGCRLEKRRNSTSNPQNACFSCHKDFDSVGMGFERFNENGEYRSTEKSDPSCSTIADFHISSEKSYKTMAEYTKAISETDQVARCLAVKIKSYAYGADLNTKKSNQVFVETEKFKKTLNFEDLIIDIVSNSQFVLREGRDGK